jgi:hypothetical protein
MWVVRGAGQTGCLRIAAYMLSCPGREHLRAGTLRNLARTDWDEEPRVVLDETAYARRQERQEETALRLLEEALAHDAELVLFLEDDLVFNRHLRHNLECWSPLAEAGAGHFFASLYNPSVTARSRDPGRAFFVAEPECVYGSQALLLARMTVRHAVERWHEVPGMQDVKLSRLAAPFCSLYYHAPSLVQHVGLVSSWGGPYHEARDYDADWRA